MAQMNIPLSSPFQVSLPQEGPSYGGKNLTTAQMQEQGQQVQLNQQQIQDYERQKQENNTLGQLATGVTRPDGSMDVQAFQTKVMASPVSFKTKMQALQSTEKMADADTWRKMLSTPDVQGGGKDFKAMKAAAAAAGRPELYDQWLQTYGDKYTQIYDRKKKDYNEEATRLADLVSAGPNQGESEDAYQQRLQVAYMQSKAAASHFDSESYQQVMPDLNKVDDIKNWIDKTQLPETRLEYRRVAAQEKQAAKEMVLRTESAGERSQARQDSERDKYRQSLTSLRSDPEARAIVEKRQTSKDAYNTIMDAADENRTLNQNEFNSVMKDLFPGQADEATLSQSMAGAFRRLFGVDMPSTPGAINQMLLKRAQQQGKYADTAWKTAIAGKAVLPSTLKNDSDAQQLQKDVVEGNSFQNFVLDRIKSKLPVYKTQAEAEKNLKHGNMYKDADGNVRQVP